MGSGKWKDLSFEGMCEPVKKIMMDKGQFTTSTKCVDMVHTWQMQH